ncbi:hypothetical protein BJP62_15335 [Jeongeupia sp. USM3]|nr:hypothetical protein BJP62_15335 [Jeongeupia sp. USM3]
MATKAASSRDPGQREDFGSALAREVAARQPAQTTESKDASTAQQDARDDAPEPGDAATPWLALLQSMAQVVAQPLPQEEEVAGATLQDTPVDPLAAAVTPALMPQVATATVQDGADAPAAAAVQAAAPLATETDEVAAHGKPLPAGLAAVETGENGETVDPAQFAAARSETAFRPAAEPVAAPVKPAPTHHVSTPVGESRWGDAVAQRVAMMIGRQEQKLEMQLNPPNLGPMDVQLTLAHDQASVVFASQHAAVREALAAATPRLTALLADQGIQLVNVQVASDSLNQHAQQQAQSDPGPSQQRSPGGTSAAEPAELRVDLGTRRLPVSGGGLSFYA